MIVQFWWPCGGWSSMFVMIHAKYFVHVSQSSVMMTRYETQILPDNFDLWILFYLFVYSKLVFSMRNDVIFPSLCYKSQKSGRIWNIFVLVLSMWREWGPDVLWLATTWSNPTNHSRTRSRCPFPYVRRICIKIFLEAWRKCVFAQRMVATQVQITQWQP